MVLLPPFILATMNSLIVKKYIIGSTGLFLCIFLVVHLSANLILIWPEETASKAYNAYASFLAGNSFIKLVAYLLYASILFHILYALLITLNNRKARNSTYHLNRSNENSSWASQNMGLLGTLILLFIVVHLGNFWARAKLGFGEDIPMDAFGNKDLYALTNELFINPFYVGFYSLLMIPLGYHLFHGLKSAFKSIGVYHKNGMRTINRISLLYAIAIAVGFGVIPIFMFIKNL